MFKMSRVSIMCAAVVLFAGMAQAASWNSFVIRNGSSGSPAINSNPATFPTGTTEFVINEGGMKAGLGSNDINGFTIGGITQLTITRHDDTGRFTSGSGPAVAPYFNIWVTDGAGKYAVIANEPSNPAFQALFQVNGSLKTYDLSFSDLSDKVAQVYETPGGGYNTFTSWVHQAVLDANPGRAPFSVSDPLTFSELAGLTIEAPDVSYITNGANAVGTGAPDELNTNVAYGFNWVFGDTLSNYESGDLGYVVSDFAVNATVVPVPQAALVGGLGLCLIPLLRRKRSKSIA